MHINIHRIKEIEIKTVDEFERNEFEREDKEDKFYRRNLVIRTTDGEKHELKLFADGTNELVPIFEELEPIVKK